MIMYYEQNRTGIQGDLVYTIQTGFHQIRILAFLRNNLIQFSEDFKNTPRTNISQDIDIDYENYISTELSFFLNNNVIESGYLFGFEATGPDILVRQFGSGVHSPTLLFIEAKRLPPTNSKDYVKSGMGRFKREEHGKQHRIAAMLGYVQSRDFEYWYNEVNSWIEDFISANDKGIRWERQDKICIIQIKDIGEYKSMHSRITEDSITLYHFWIRVNGGN